MNRNLIFGGILSAALMVSGLLYAQKEHINPHLHPNLAAAQRMAQQAIMKVDAAQKANEFDMAGHAAKAKELLEQASSELKAAAEEANEHKQ